MQVKLLYIMYITHDLHNTAYLTIEHIVHAQEYDKIMCEPHPSCHCCPTGILEFLGTDFFVCSRIHRCKARGNHCSAMSLHLKLNCWEKECGVWGVVEGSVVEWDKDGPAHPTMKKMEKTS